MVMQFCFIVFCICIALCNGEAYRRRDTVTKSQHASFQTVKEVYSDVKDDLKRPTSFKHKELAGGTFTNKVQSRLMEMNPEDAIDNIFKIYDLGEAIYNDINEGTYENTARFASSESVEYLAKESCGYIFDAVFDTNKSSWRNRLATWACGRAGNKIGQWMSD
ncbi:hypothetical protein C0J52_12868 [Blattella germanica]|nr:hypothetical protein C0J52_12868 [Blattella germanica]